MSRLLLAMFMASVVTATASAQRPQERPDPFGREISAGEITPTPDMWFYQQELRLWQDPKVAVRRKAEFRTAQRMRRIAAQRWFGINNLRPMASPIPYWGGSASPYWASNSRDPYRWMGIGGSPVVVRRARPAGFYGLW